MCKNNKTRTQELKPCINNLPFWDVLTLNYYHSENLTHGKMGRGGRGGGLEFSPY